MKNYEMIHMIQDSGLPKNVQNVVVRAFNKMSDAKEPDGCLSISVSLCVALEQLGYSPMLCIGKFWYGEHDYYHAWTELDGKIIDVAIYGNSSFSPYWKDGVIKPQVNKSYDETDVKYEPFVFDEDFKNALISQMMGRTYYYYCDNAPRHNAIWNLIMYYLDTSSMDVLQSVKDIARKHTIGERGKGNA